MEPKTTYATPAIYRPGDDYARLLNANKSFEGGGLLPPPGGGFQIPPVTEFRVARVEPQIGGAKVSLTWLAEKLEIHDRVQIQTWISSDFANFSSEINPRDINFSTLVTYGAPVVFADSPGEIFIPTTRPIIVVITAATMHSSGVVTLREFQPTVAVEITPVGSYQDWKAASFTVDATRSVTYLIDTSGGALTATLPPVLSTIPGIVTTLKKTTADANAITISGPQNIDGAASVSTGATAYATVQVTSDHRYNVWHRLI